MYKTNNWKDVNETASFKNLGTVSWNDTTGVCKIYSSVLIKIIYGKTGFDENP